MPFLCIADGTSCEKPRYHKPTKPLKFKMTNGLSVYDQHHGFKGDYTLKVPWNRIKDDTLIEDLRHIFYFIPDHNDFSSVDLYILRNGRGKHRWDYEVFLVFNHYEDCDIESLAHIIAGMNELRGCFECDYAFVALLNHNWEKMILSFSHPTRGILDILTGKRTRDDYEDEKMNLINSHSKRLALEFEKRNDRF